MPRQPRSRTEQPLLDRDGKAAGIVEDCGEVNAAMTKFPHPECPIAVRPHSSAAPRHMPRRGARRLAPRVVTAALLMVVGVSLIRPPSSGAAGSTSPAASAHVLMLLSRRGAALDRFVAALSDPASPQYRHFLTIEQLARRFGASPSTKSAVLSWLRAHTMRGTLDVTGTYVEVTLTLAQRHSLFPTAFTASSKRSSSLPVPRSLAGRVTSVIAGDTPMQAVPAASGASAGHLVGGFNPNGSSVRQRTGTPSGCPAGANAGTAGRVAAGFAGFTPNQYLTAYGFPRLIRQDLRGTGERIAVVEFGGFRASDVATFARCFGLPAPHLRVIPVLVSRPLPPLDETTLDLEVLSAASPRATSIDVYEGAGSIAGFVRTIAEPLRQRSRRPNVESISYSICEARLSGMVPVFRAVNTVLEFEAAAGISVFAASGDTGSPGCSLNQNRSALPLLSVGFPASSPYATGVGGLNFTLTPANRLATEVAWNDSPIAFGAGGGGPSLLFSRPSWQSVPGAFSVMREVPDVSMLADGLPGYAIYCSPPACASPPGELNPGWIDVGGTSAATPLLAGAVADADQEAARHHQPPLGFVNPLLYDVARALRLGVVRDVRQGNNDLGKLITGTPIGCCDAHRGYDAASGVGSVNVDALSRAALRAYRHTLPPQALRR